MIIYHSQTTQTVNLSTAPGLIVILCFHKYTYSTSCYRAEKIRSRLSAHQALCNEHVYLLIYRSAERGVKETVHLLCWLLLRVFCICVCTHVSVHVQRCGMFCTSSEHISHHLTHCGRLVSLEASTLFQHCPETTK